MRTNCFHDIIFLAPAFFPCPPLDLTNHEKLELNQEPNVEYLGHPINAYNLIKHSALGWAMFHEDVIPKLNETLPKLEQILSYA